ncbi:MAG: hypothetical protein CVU89_01720 [Firmicutes bacterium HGW-Firmicutes-14]|nr:MAG: hypothetical protein CVU89_01720 [Firmicutes bacterium HGW-Firmicutes-14]
MRKVLLLFIGVMIIFAAGCGGSKTQSYSADSPEGTVQAYYQALENGKPGDAYEYRKFDPPKSKDEFVKEQRMPFEDFTIAGKAEIQGNTATVPVKFKTGVSTMPEITMDVALQKDKKWQITGFNVGGGTMGGSGDGAPSDMPPSGMPPTGGTADGQTANPHAPGGSIPLDGQNQ